MIDVVTGTILLLLCGVAAYLLGRSDGYVQGWRDALKPKKKE